MSIPLTFNYDELIAYNRKQAWLHLACGDWKRFREYRDRARQIESTKALADRRNAK